MKNKIVNIILNLIFLIIFIIFFISLLKIIPKLNYNSFFFKIMQLEFSLKRLYQIVLINCSFFLWVYIYFLLRKKNNNNNDNYSDDLSDVYAKELDNSNIKIVEIILYIIKSRQNYKDYFSIALNGKWGIKKLQF